MEIRGLIQLEIEELVIGSVKDRGINFNQFTSNARGII